MGCAANKLSAGAALSHNPQKPRFPARLLSFLAQDSIRSCTKTKAKLKEIEKYQT
jgi:hypothetical protein